MRKTMLIILAAMLLLTMPACGKAPAEPLAAAESTPAEPPTAAESEPAEPPTAAEPAPDGMENKITLSLDKNTYQQGETIEVTLDFNELRQDEATIAIVPADREHGSEAAASEAYNEYGYEYRYLSDFSEIPFYLWAPEEDGLFDVRVYAKSEGGEELAYLTIAVGNAQIPEG